MGLQDIDDTVNEVRGRHEPETYFFNSVATGFGQQCREMFLGSNGDLSGILIRFHHINKAIMRNICSDESC